MVVKTVTTHDVSVPMKGATVIDRPTVVPSRRALTVFAMDPVHLPGLFPADLVQRLVDLAHLDPALCVQDFADPRHAALLAETEVLITGWGCPQIDEAALARVPKLRAVLHAAGSVRGMITEAVWEQRVLVTSAAVANAAPVAEFTLAAVIFAAKNAFGARDHYRDTHSYQTNQQTATIGTYRRRLGVIGASNVGRRVLELIRPLDLDVVISDPYLDAAQAESLGARLVELDGLLASCDIVSLHAPDLPSTRHLIDRRRLALIPDGGCFINTARGRVVDEQALTEELVSGRISAMLDVTEVEPLPADSPLYRLPNVFLTPHIAGSLGNELARLGAAAVTELERYSAGLPPLHPVRQADLAHVA
jgi:phosphoglycerate dehydrogenase-like enzyme